MCRYCRSLFVLFLLTIVLSVLRFTDSDYTLGIFKPFLVNKSLNKPILTIHNIQTRYNMMTVICQQSDIPRMQNTSTQKLYYCRGNSLCINMDINLQRLNTATTNYRDHTDKRYLMVIKCVESNFNLEIGFFKSQTMEFVVLPLTFHNLEMLNKLHTTNKISMQLVITSDLQPTQ